MTQNFNISPRTQFVIVAIALVALTRLLPHPFNFTPIGAMALFAGTYIKNKKHAFLFPIITLLISDILLQIVNGSGFYRDMVFVYGSFALITAMGFLLRGREQRQTIMVASLVGSILFFFITNFGSWLMYSDTYARSLDGLMTSYIAGIPFFRGTIMGDLFYNFVLFASFALAKWRYPVLAKA